MSKTIAVIRGDGIGPEIMAATLKVLDALECGLEYEFVEAGMVALEKHGELLPQTTLDVIAKHGIALKGPLTTPIGKGFSSLNVALRRHFDLYANVRPAKSFPNTKSRFPTGVDLITVRENTEGVYIGEGQEVSADGATAVLTSKVTRKGSERIVRYAFELAKSAGRTLAYRSKRLRSSTLIELKPSPTGVVNGDFSAMRFLRIESMVAAGSSSPCFSSATRPASANSYCRPSCMVSSTCRVASMISGPMPSPRITVIVVVIFDDSRQADATRWGVASWGFSP